MSLLCLWALSAPCVGLVPTPAQPQQAPARVTSFQDPHSFSSQVEILGFRGMPEGMALENSMGVYGVRLRLGRGGPPCIWLDRATRCYPPISAAALSNRVTIDRRLGHAPKHEQRVEECAMVANFEVPVNRAALELRGLEDDELNVILRCFFQGEELGSHFYDVGMGFQYLGVQCSRPFDELRIELTNPTDALVSIDNLACEYDLRDGDRDGVLDFQDTCPSEANPDQLDSDGDGIGDLCDPFPLDAENDIDGDGLGADIDNCPYLFNPEQRDNDHDGIGDSCDDFPFGSDVDNDGIGDLVDNCPTTFNPEQADCDLDGIGDVCDPSLVDPASVSYNLRRGECVTLQKSVCLPPAPPVVDVVILFDTTGSMGGEIQNLRLGVTGFVNGVRAALPLSDVRFGLVGFRDYPDSYDSCGYSARYGLPTDMPFQVLAPIGASNQEVLQAVTGLRALGGQDRYESYSRALWEISQPDSGIGFRPDSARFVLLVGDSAPHDCNLGLFLAGCVPAISSGRDPGRDGIARTADDIDFQQDALAGLRDTNTRVLMIYTGVPAFCSWQRWCSLTGGVAVQGGPDGTLPPGTNLVQRLVNLIRDPEVTRVTYQAENPCGLQVSFDPPRIDGPIDVSMGARVTFLETICVPDNLPAGPVDCTVRIFADSVLLGVQRIHVDAECAMHVLDFETEDDFTTPLANGQALSSPPEFGRMVRLSSSGANAGPVTFDSTPGGPNAPSINSDMLIGHGNLLLLQDNAYPRQSIPGIFDVVTDDPQGGDMVLDFPLPIDPRSVLLADINPPPNQGASVTLTDEAGKTRVYAIDPGWTGPYGNAGPRVLNLATNAVQPGYGVRRAVATEQAGFQQTRVARIVVHMTGYGAIDELTFCR